MKFTILVFSLFVFLGNISGQTIIVEITDVRNSNGHLLLGIYTNDEDYQDKVAVMKKTVLKTELKDGKVTARIEGLGPGVYGIALMDDEDWDRKMAYKFVFPKEGFAFSNYYHEDFRKPRFEDFRFILGTEDKTVVMKCKYLYKAGE